MSGFELFWVPLSPKMEQNCQLVGQKTPYSLIWGWHGTTFAKMCAFIFLTKNRPKKCFAQKRKTSPFLMPAKPWSRTVVCQGRNLHCHTPSPCLWPPPGSACLIIIIIMISACLPPQLWKVPHYHHGRDLLYLQKVNIALLKRVGEHCIVNKGR